MIHAITIVEPYRTKCMSSVQKIYKRVSVTVATLVKFHDSADNISLTQGMKIVS